MPSELAMRIARASIEWIGLPEILAPNNNPDSEIVEDLAKLIDAELKAEMEDIRELCSQAAIRIKRGPRHDQDPPLLKKLVEVAIGKP